MNWKYLKRAIFLLIVILMAIPAYRYFGSIDWAKEHTARIATLPVLTELNDCGEFRIPIGEFEFLARVAGLQNEGPAVILLHGFPESSIMWTDLLDKADNEGYRVVAFDQRGYSPGARPKGVTNYHIDHLTNDVIAMANEVGFDTFHLVGHDWGAVVSWNVALEHAERLHSLTTMAIPHIGVFFDGIINDQEQQLRSGYMKMLQKPFLPEYKFLANDQAFYKQMMHQSKKTHLDEYLGLFAEHGAATATFNWYRALEIEEIVSLNTYRTEIKTPTLFIWGTEDGVIAPSIIPHQKEWISAPYREVSLPTGHGLIQSKPDTVIAEIIAHFRREEVL